MIFIHLGSLSHNMVLSVLYYLILTCQLAASQQSVAPPEGPSHMVNPDEVKAVIDSENSITNKLIANGKSTFDTLQKAGSSTVNNVGWFTTSLLSNTLKVLSNTMEAVKNLGANTLGTGVQLGVNTGKFAGGALRGVLGYAKAGTKGLENQLTNASSFMKNVSKNPENLIPQAAISGVSALIPSDSVKTVYNSTLSSVGTVGWLVTDTLAETLYILENTVDLIDNMGTQVVETGYKLGANGAEVAGALVGGGYNFVGNGLAAGGQQMEGYAKSFKDKLAPQQLVDVPLTDGAPKAQS